MSMPRSATISAITRLLAWVKARSLRSPSSAAEATAGKPYFSLRRWKKPPSASMATSGGIGLPRGAP